MSGRGGYRGRDRRGGRGGPSQSQPAVVTPAFLLQDAETLQQRAERRSGQDALQAFQAATAKYREALAAGLDAEGTVDASFGLAECLQSWGDLQRELLQQAPDDVLAQQGHVQQVQTTVAEAYRASLGAYKQVPATAGSSELRPDAAVNAANVLCSLAELCEGQEVLVLLTQAVQLYRSALAQEEDAATLSNLADAQVALGEAALQAGQAAEGQSAFESALQSYQASCALSDSANGDDLPGLLHNWGAGLHTISKHATDQQLKQSLLDQAASQLRSSIQFSRADPAPHNALGDVLMDAAELIISSSSSSINGVVQSDEAGQAGSQGNGPLPDAAAAQVAAAIKSAVDEGYMAALTICRTNADALVGLAEAGVAMAKLAARQGDQAGAVTHIAAALGHYNSALQRPHLLGDATERADVRYNAACAAALAGQTAVAQQLLQGLAAAKALVAAEVAADEDLAGLRSEAWFVQMLQKLQPAQ